MWQKKKGMNHVLSASTMMGVSHWKQFQTIFRELLASGIEIREASYISRLRVLGLIPFQKKEVVWFLEEIGTQHIWDVTTLFEKHQDCVRETLKVFLHTRQPCSIPFSTMDSVTNVSNGQFMYSIVSTYALAQNLRELNPSYITNFSSTKYD